MKEASSVDAPKIPLASVVLLAGLPASGKSTLARKLDERFNADSNDAFCDRPNVEDNSRKLIHIEYDELEDDMLPSVQSEEDGSECTEDEALGIRQREAWNNARLSAVQEMEKKIQQLFTCDTQGSVIILMDDNFHLRGMRKQIHRLLLKYKPIRFGILHLTTPLEVCLERNLMRSGRRRIPSHVIEKMEASFEPPRVAWEVSSTKMIHDGDVSDNTRFDEIVEFVRSCPEIVDLPSDEVDFEKQAADRAKTRENEAHGLDKLLRSNVGKVARFDKTLAKKANNARRTVMEDFKAGRIETEGIIEAFLDSVLPTDSTMRPKLQEILDQ